MCEVGHSVHVLVSLVDRQSYPNLEAKTHADHRTALIQTQHSGCALPEGIHKQMEEHRRRGDGRRKGGSSKKGNDKMKTVRKKQVMLG